MATRQTRLVIKNNTVPSAPFSGATLLKGEAIVNTADGILMFSGVTSSSANWTPAGPGGNATFFEVGSNLYDLKIRNQITAYSGVTNLSGKFLSGTTNGFVLADISDIAGVDSYTTGATWNPNVLTLKLNNGKPNVSVNINAFTALTVGNLTVTGTTALSGSAYYYGTVSGTNPNELINLDYLTGFSQTNDVYVTGSTLTPATNNTDSQTSTLLYHGVPLGGGYTIVTDNTFTTGGTYDNNTALITFDKNDGSSYTVSLSGIDVNDTYVTGGTVTSGGTLNLVRNDSVTVSIPKVTYWTSGSTGSFAIKAINNSGLDSTGDRAVAWGNGTLASGDDSTAWGIQTSATTSGSTASGFQTLASGLYSHAEGGETTAIGNYSHAEGQQTTARGNFSHSEGYQTIASGATSHSEGYLTSAIGTSSHAEGDFTTALGDFSHAEGNQTIASGSSSHAEGVLTKALGNYSHAEGYFTTAIGDYSHAEGQFTIASGISSHAEGANTIASGQFSHSEGFQTTASGDYSHAEGQFTIASGDRSHAEGYETIAIGNFSHSEGYQSTSNGESSHAEGQGTIASGDRSHAEGDGTIAISNGAHSEGGSTRAGYKGFSVDGVVNGVITLNSSYGDVTSEFFSGTVYLTNSPDDLYTFTTVTFSSSTNTEIILNDISVNLGGVAVVDIGNLNSAFADGVDGNSAHAEGVSSKALGSASHAEGEGSISVGTASHAEGGETTAGGYSSHAEGYLTTAIGESSHSEGFSTRSFGDRSHTEGEYTNAYGVAAHAEGNQTIASGASSHAEGLGTSAIGSQSHSEGYGTKAIGSQSHAEGYYTTAIGIASHTEGSQTTANGDYSHAEGYGTTAIGLLSHAGGAITVASGITSFIHSSGSTVTGDRSVVLGGQGITGTTNDTVYVPYLNLNYVPTLNNSNTQILSRNTATGQVEYTNLSAFTSLDTYVTGFTYNPATNVFTIKQNQGQPDLTAQINSVTGLTISTLGANRVVYTTGSGTLTTESGFEYSASANTLTVGNINVQNASGTTANIGQGGLVIGSGGSLASPGIGDLTVHGDFTVFGTTTTVATSELYVEDPQITLNYSTGSTTVTSVSSGLRIQDGNGVVSGDVYFTIGQMQNLTGLTPTEIPSVAEYTGLTGYANRGWVSQLNDIVIRNTNLNEGSPNGVRVLAEFDTLDGGQY
jgi:hypothetical protein